MSTEQIEEYRHPSGVRVVLLRRSGPVASFQFWIGAGSAGEAADEQGVAHLLEHMVFKRGWAGRTRELAAEIEEVGGSVNAWTSHDRTMFYATVPRTFRGEGLESLAGSVFGCCADADAVAREVEVVLDEMLRSNDNPARMLRQSVFRAAFAGHPYARDVIGTAESIASLGPAQVESFYRRWYRPDNITLLAAGDVNRAEIDAILQRTVPTSTHGTAAVSSGEPGWPSEATATVELADVSNAQVVLAFRVPGALADDAAAIEVLASLLGEGGSSRLVSTLQRGAGLVVGTSSGTFQADRGGLLVVNATWQPGPERTARGVIRALVHELVRLQESPISAREVQRTVRSLESEAIWERQTVQGAASRLGGFVAQFGEVSAEASYLRSLHAVDAYAVREAARRWLRPDQVHIGLLLPAASVPPSTSEALEWVGAAWREAQAMQGDVAVVPDADGVVFHRYANGLRLIVERDASAPIVAIRALVPGGSSAEDSAHAGAHALLASLLKSGTGRYSAHELAVRLDSLQASIDAYAGRDTIGLGMNALTRDLDEALEIFVDALFWSTLPQDELDQRRRELLARLDAARDSPQATAFEQFGDAAFAGHPYERPLLGTAASLEGLEREELLALYASTVRPERMVVAVVGDVDPLEIVDRVGGLFDVAPVGDAAPPTPMVVAPSPAVPVETVSVRERQQTHVVLGFIAPPAGHDDEAAMRVIAAVLGGQSGRLFAEVRERQALAYSVGATYAPGRWGGSLALYVATSNENEEAALVALRGELQRLRDEGIRPDELQRAVRLLVGQRESGLQTGAARSMMYVHDELAGPGYRWGREFSARMEQVTASEVSAVLARWLSGQGEVLSIVRGAPGQAGAAENPEVGM